VKVIVPSDTTPLYKFGTFTRASSGRYVNDFGQIASAANNIPRWESGALLYEAASQNYILRSEEFDAAAWSKNGLAVTSNTLQSPATGATADTIAATAGSGIIYRYVAQVATISTQQTYTASIYVKRGTLASGGIALAIFDYGVAHGCYADFDLFSLAVPTINSVGGSWVAGTATVQQLANGWVRLSVTATANTTFTGLQLYAFLGSYAETPDTTGTVSLWGAQLEPGSKPTSYIPTTAATVTRAADNWAGDIITNLVESDAIDGPEWSAATAYYAGDEVRITARHRKFRRLVDGTTATAPNLDLVNWLDIGPTNPAAMFDTELVAPTSGYSDDILVAMRLVESTGIYHNAIGLLGLYGSTVTITACDYLGGPAVYSETINIQPGYADAITRYTSNLGRSINSVVFVAIKKYGSIRANCEKLVLGRGHEIGGTEYGAEYEIIDYSRKETDEFGTTTLVKRKFSKRISAKLNIDNSDFAAIVSLMASIRAELCVWETANAVNLSPTIIYGYYRSFSASIIYETFSVASLVVESLA
jgi:hypothetical protein